MAPGGQVIRIYNSDIFHRGETPGMAITRL
jgi:hypothetical protein